MLRFALVVWLMSAGAAVANERSAAILDSFQAFFMPGPPDFAALDARASAMKLPVRKDVGKPPQAGNFARLKSWLVTLDGGTHELVASEARGAAGEVAACGIGADDVDGEDVKQALIVAMKPGAPLRQTASADGAQRLTVWKYPNDTTLLLADGTPMKIPGVFLTLLHQIATSR